MLRMRITSQYAHRGADKTHYQGSHHPTLILTPCNEGLSLSSLTPLSALPDSTRNSGSDSPLDLDDQPNSAETREVTSAAAVVAVASIPGACASLSEL
jgi:hypothetical protein